MQGWRVESVLAVDLEPRVRHLLAQPEFAGRFEILPEPVGETFAYLVASPSTYASQGARVERRWTELGRLRRSPGAALRCCLQAGVVALPVGLLILRQRAGARWGRYRCSAYRAAPLSEPRSI